MKHPSYFDSCEEEADGEDLDADADGDMDIDGEGELDAEGEADEHVLDFDAEVPPTPVLPVATFSK